jgi:hypothetical protein
MRWFTGIVPAGIGRKNESGAGKLRYRDVVRMAISSIGSKRRDNMGTDPANVSGDFPLHLSRIGAVQVSIDIVQKVHAANSQFLRRCAQFRFAGFPYYAQFRPHRRIAEPAALTTRRGDEMCIDTLARVFRQSSAHPERFVVGMGEDAHQSKFVFHSRKYRRA